MEPVRKGRFVTRLWWVVAALLVLLALLIAQTMVASRHQHEEQAVVETYSVARVLESDLAGLVDKVKLALHTVATERERQLAGAPIDETEFRTFVANIHANVPEILGIRVSDAVGRILYQAEFANAPAAESMEQPYFARLRNTNEPGIVISGLHRDGPDGPWVIDIARRIEYADGRFAGAVIAPIPIDRLVTLLAAADAGSNGAVTLRGEGLEIIARHPPLAEPASQGTVPDALRELVERGEISGTFHAAAPVDGVERLYSYRRITGYPLHITVGRATAEYLGHWRRDMGVVVVLSSVLFAVAIGAAVMVDRAWRHQRRVTRLLETQAHTDALTGLASRRHFFETAEAELVRSRRYDAPLSLLMLDIDHFKDVNDAHGHRAGDRVLRQLAATCREVLRTVDEVGRVGGEEFAILLPETAIEGAIEVAERLRVAIGNAEVTRDEGVPLRISVSIGVAALADGTNLDTLMSQADSALYDAKHHGRNQVRAFAQAA
ncbi:MAG: diguanylate cyclase [Betaproteobacteria bacterium]|nr:diguanylate cyclase [Betaproteobacteria bacterium]